MMMMTAMRVLKKLGAKKMMKMLIMTAMMTLMKMVTNKIMAKFKVVKIFGKKGRRFRERERDSVIWLVGFQDEKHSGRW